MSRNAKLGFRSDLGRIRSEQDVDKKRLTTTDAHAKDNVTELRHAYEANGGENIAVVVIYSVASVYAFSNFVYG